MLGIGKTLVFRLLSAGEIDSITIGGLRKIPADALARCRERRCPEQTPAAENLEAVRMSLYSVRQAAALLGISRTLVFRLLSTGEIDSITIGRLRKVPGDALIDYIERRRAAPKSNRL